jgi:carbon storage regulator
MLALTRKKGESIIVGDNIEVVVLGITGEQVRLGIIAPKNITVHRKEIFEQIRLENKEATQNLREKMSKLKELGNKDIGGVAP